MSNLEYLTVNQFAKKVGLTRQAVYLKLDKELKDYLHIIDNQKMINIKALELFDVKIDSKENVTLIDSLKLQISNLQEIVNFLQEQLTEKDKQINNLQNLLNQEQHLQLLQAPKKSWIKRIFNKSS